MNENIDLTKILKDCPKGFKLYTPLFGEVELKVIGDNEYPIITTPTGDDCSIASFTKEGFYYERKDAECLLFPSAEQRDWRRFNAPLYKKELFNPETLAPFDKVLVRDDFSETWRCDFFSHMYNDNRNFPYFTIRDRFKYCIPYNEDTACLVGTKDEPLEFYRYWED